MSAVLFKQGVSKALELELGARSQKFTSKGQQDLSYLRAHPPPTTLQELDVEHRGQSAPNLRPTGRSNGRAPTRPAPTLTFVLVFQPVLTTSTYVVAWSKRKRTKKCLVSSTTQPKDGSSLAGLFRETGGWWGPHPLAPAPAPVTHRLCIWLSCLREE